MTAKLSSDAIEIGVVVRDAERSLEFYRDVLGLPYLGDLDFGVALEVWTGGRADDDCRYFPDTVERVVEAFAAHPEWGALCGITCDESGRPTQLRWDRTGGTVTRKNIWRRAIGSTTRTGAPERAVRMNSVRSLSRETA